MGAARALTPVLALCIIVLAAPLPAATPDHIEVATWNLEYFNTGARGFPETPNAYGPRTAEGLRAIAKVISEKLGLEVVGLEEVVSEADLKSLIAYLPSYRECVVNDGARQHCALIWDSSQVEVTIRKPFTELQVSSGQRQGLHASIRAGRFTFDYLVVHLAGEIAKSRVQCPMLTRWVAGQCADSRPTDPDVIIGGDFNLTPEQAPLKALVANPLLVWCFRGFSVLPPTRPVSGKTIDHLFMTPSCYANRWPNSTASVPQLQGNNLTEYRRLISDHLPVIESFRTDRDPPHP